MTSRREFLRLVGLASAAAAAPAALDALSARLAAGVELASTGYGPLVRDPARLLDLPANFRYRALSTAILGTDADPRFSQRLTGGEPVPALHDGMAAFRGRSGVTVLVRNHELDVGNGPAVAPDRSPRYDPLAPGGTTTLWVDSRGRLVRSFASLSGTLRNCAGGKTPWDSWLSAEECTWTPGPADRASYDQRADVRRRHGYIFEVNARSEGLVQPTPIKAMGRFCHEAVAMDPLTGYAYLSEDRGDGLLYRYRPDVVTSGHKRPRALAVGDLAKGGILEALRIVGHPAARTQNWEGGSPFVVGTDFAVDWVRIPEVDPDVDLERDPTDPEPDPLRRRGRTSPRSTRAQGLGLGAAQFTRNEGICWAKGAIYFCATDGGSARAGQVWKLDPSTSRLSLVLEPNDRKQLEAPDNLAPAPNGDIIVCEDGPGENFVLGITPQGRLYRLARNAHNRSEFAGACFSPDGRTMFVNLQNPGITFAIQGPWGRRHA